MAQPATSPSGSDPDISQATLELCDWLIDGISLSAQAPDFLDQAQRIAHAKTEIGAALRAAGGTPLAEQRNNAAR